jgi:hypothetical protein
MVNITIGKGDKGYNLEITVTNSTGGVRDLTGYTITLQAWRPSAPGTFIVNSGATSPNPATGVCKYLLQSTDFTSSNYYEGKLILTKGTTQQESVESFLIAIPDSAYYCSVAELKNELQITGADHDFQLQSLVMQAQTYIDQYCKRTFMVGSSGVERYFDGSDSPFWVDDCVAVQKINLDEEMDGTYSSTMAATDYHLMPYNSNPKTYIVLSSNSGFGGFADGTTKGVKVTGTWGYDTSVPEDIRRASIIQCCRWFKRADTAYASMMGPNELGVIQTFTGLDPDVKAILFNYVRTQYAR